MTTLLVAEHDASGLKDVTARALTAAKALGAPVHVLVLGAGAASAAQAAARLDGVAKVLTADASYEHRLAEPAAALIVSLAADYDAILAPSTAAWKNVLPRVAALLDVMQVSDIVKVVAPDTFERPIYAGNAVQTVQSSDAKKVITVRTPFSLAAASAAALAPLPATSTSTSEPICRAADSALAVWSERLALSCSAMRRIAIFFVLS